MLSRPWSEFCNVHSTLLTWNILNKKETHIIVNGKFDNCKNYTENCLVWFNSSTSRESSIVKQKFIVAFWSVQQTVKCSNVNTKLCAPCTILHLRDMNGLRWIILAGGCHSKPIGLPARHNCTMVLEVPDEVPDGEYAGQSSVWTAFELGNTCVRQIEDGTALDHSPWHCAARHCLFKMGPRYGRRARSVNRLRLLRMVCVNTWALWRFGVSAAVLVDGLRWSQRCLKRICQSFEGVTLEGSPLRGGWFQVVPISCRRCLNHRIVVCGTLKRLMPSAFLKLVCSIPIVLSLSKMVKP